MHITLRLTLVPAIYLLFQSSLTAANTPEITARRLTVAYPRLGKYTLEFFAP
jgi:hypothetical protein